MRYSALLGGLVNSAAMTALLGKELTQDSETDTTVASNFLLSDMSRIVRDGVLVIIFSWPLGLQASVVPVMVLFTLVLAAGATALLVILRSEKKPQHH